MPKGQEKLLDSTGGVSVSFAFVPSYWIIFSLLVASKVSFHLLSDGTIIYCPCSYKQLESSSGTWRAIKNSITALDLIGSSLSNLKPGETKEKVYKLLDDTNESPVVSDG